MSKTIETMTGVELDAFGAAHDTDRIFRNGKVEPDSYYRERIKVEMAKSSSLQFPPISLRDYFAAKALATVPAYSQEDVATWSAEDFARHAYVLADAMLAARSA